MKKDNTYYYAALRKGKVLLYTIVISAANPTQYNIAGFLQHKLVQQGKLKAEGLDYNWVEAKALSSKEKITKNPLIIIKQGEFAYALFGAMALNTTNTYMAKQMHELKAGVEEDMEKSLREFFNRLEINGDSFDYRWMSEEEYDMED